MQYKKKYTGIKNEVLAETRRSLGLTQEQVKDRLGLKTFKVVSNWELGYSAPPLFTAIKLARIYGTSVEKLFGHIIDEVDGND